MTELFVDAVEKFMWWGIGLAIVIVIAIGIIQRIMDRKRYGKVEETELPTFEPMDHYGAMPTTGKYTKHDFGYDEKQEQSISRYERN